MFFHKYTTRYSRSQGMDRIPGRQLFILQEPRYLKENCFQFLLLCSLLCLVLFS